MTEENEKISKIQDELIEIKKLCKIGFDNSQGWNQLNYNDIEKKVMRINSILTGEK